MMMRMMTISDLKFKTTIFGRWLKQAYLYASSVLHLVTHGFAEVVVYLTQWVLLSSSIRSPDSEDFTGEEVGAFIKGLEEHFYECFKVKLWVGPLFHPEHYRSFCLLGSLQNLIFLSLKNKTIFNIRSNFYHWKERREGNNAVWI